MIPPAAQSIRAEFLLEAAEWGERRGYTVDRDPMGANFVRVGDDEREWLLYVKTRSEEPGFWGVTRNRLDEIVANEERWAVVLLVETADTGYLLFGLTVLHRSTAKWTLGSDGDYKVNENRDVEARERFDSVAECMERLVAAGP